MAWERKDLPGTPLKSQDFAEGKVLFTDWKPKAVYHWDTGTAIGTFLQGLKEGKLLGRKCTRCGRVLIPPRMFCERCFRPTDYWVELPDTGRINTFSISFVDRDANRIQIPQVPAVIEIDGAGPGMGILHLLGEVGTTLEEIRQRVRIGMRVQAVWKPPQEREGSITDIRYFKPLEEEG